MTMGENLTPNRAKRNLNKSFNNTPNSQIDENDDDDVEDIRNYSIIEDDTTNPLKLKLRISQQCMQPKVFLEKLDNQTIEKLTNVKRNVEEDVVETFTPRKSGRPRKVVCPYSPMIVESPRRSTRHSARKVSRVSYAELISPIKSERTKYGEDDEYYTPKKRTRKPSQSEVINKENVMHNKVAELKAQETPRKRRQSVDTPTKKRSLDTLDHEINEIMTTLSQQMLNTPKKRSNGTPKKRVETPIAKTPSSSRLKLIREGVITPSMQSRHTVAKNVSTPLNTAKANLHVSHVPNSLPCRENEYADIMNFVEGKLLDGCGGCMYVSGVPGTGKTATVTEVIRNLQVKSKLDLPMFQFVGINGMRLTEPRQAYVEILKQLNGKTVAWEQAQSLLDDKFTKKQKGAQPIVLLVDELDILCTKRQDVVYNLLDWPTKAKTQLIVITIANTMDLPERLLMGRVTSRLGLTRLTFQAYTHKQLQEIVTKRLIGTNAFKPDAIQLVARKVASVSGDARRALDICRRAVELAECEDANGLVTMKHVNDALNAMITQPKVQAIKRCSRLEQLLLQSVISEVERTGVDETNFADIYTMFETISAVDGFPLVTNTLALAAIARLGACRLLLTEQKSSDIYQKIILNVSGDDIYYALRKD